VLDPSVVENFTLPHDDRELIQQLDHHWLTVYDNITYVPNWASDIFCRAISGSGFSKRELYSDDEDTTYAFIRCILLNGINPAARRGDLLDRTILVGLEQIPPEHRKTEEEALREFEEDKATILGEILGVLSKALRLYPGVKPPKGYFRLADWHRYSCAITMALGRPLDDFVNAYAKKIELQNEETINANPTASAIYAFCQEAIKYGKWVEKGIDGTDTHIYSATPTKIYSEVSEFATLTGMKTDPKSGWPRAANTFMAKLNDAVSSLAAEGIKIKTAHTRVTRIVTLDATEFAIRNGVSPLSPPSDPASITALGVPNLQVYDVHHGEKCGCGALAVTKELHSIKTGERKRRCDPCARDEMEFFKRNGCFNEMPTYGED